MLAGKRRNTNRYELNYPILVAEDATPAGNEQLAQILDAGADGICLLVASANSLQVGTELHLSCSPARDRKKGLPWEPVRVHCKVAWQDLEKRQIGLLYIQ